MICAVVRCSKQSDHDKKCVCLLNTDDLDRERQRGKQELELMV